MGVPAFFAWLSQRYPKILSECVEKAGWTAVGTEMAIDATEPNPNGTEYDSLYLDMNGIIHPCTHPEDRPPPTTEDEMFAEIFRYIDRIMDLVRPRRLLYMAVDGCAPRAKINQQRSRRFRAAQEAAEQHKEEDKIREEWLKRGLVVPQKNKSAQRFDSNVITPGTPFMYRLSIALRQYAAKRLKTNPAWRNLRVIFSDASVPGEGEHKVAEFIRQQRSQKNYDPDVHHVLYGLDADLIMLALATHELHFTVLREQVLHGQASKAAAVRNNKPPDVNAATEGKDEAGNLVGFVSSLGGKKPFQFLDIAVLREYLDFEFQPALQSGFELRKVQRARADHPAAPEERYDLEKVIDDFIFLCFFVGNDFLPHLPTLDIREGALDYLIEMYKKMVTTLGYLSDGNGNVDFEKIRVFMVEIGKLEDEVFAKRMEKNERNRQRDEADKIRKQGAPIANPDSSLKRKAPDNDANSKVADFLRQKLNPTLDVDEEETVEDSGCVFESSGGNSVREAEGFKPDEKPTELHTATEAELLEFDAAVKSKMRENNVVGEMEDEVRFGQEGWKTRYYVTKFGWHPGNAAHEEERRQLLHKYYEGLLWVFRYYYRGCPSWDWYYPYHYAPFASDLASYSVSCNSIKLESGSPFRPFEQLMSVLPAVSAKGVLPNAFVELMVDPESPIVDYYPEDFELDLNGKRYAWQGVVLLPFVDEKLLRRVLGPVFEKLTEEEQKRNRFGNCYVMASTDSALGNDIVILNDKMKFARITAKGGGGVLAGGLSGLEPEEAEELANYDGVVCAVLAMPQKRKHDPNPVPGVTVPTATLTEGDRYETERGNQGMSAARFGVLGRAASKMSIERKGGQGQQLSGHGQNVAGAGMRGRGRGRGHFNAQHGQNIGMFQVQPQMNWQQQKQHQHQQQQQWQYPQHQQHQQHQHRQHRQQQQHQQQRHHEQPQHHQLQYWQHSAPLRGRGRGVNNLPAHAQGRSIRAPVGYSQHGGEGGSTGSIDWQRQAAEDAIAAARAAQSYTHPTGSVQHARATGVRRGANHPRGGQGSAYNPFGQ